MKATPFLLHALSPLHAGTGRAADIIDLPTARMKATGIPFVPGSSIKGVLRDSCRDVDSEKTEAVFGPSDDAGLHAGALVVGDARLLLLPVRSFRGTFAWTTSPLLLTLAKRDLAEVAGPSSVPKLDGRGALVPASSACIHKGQVFLEDIDLGAKTSEEVRAWASWLVPHVSPGEDILTRRFVVVDDETMAFLCETALQVDARVCIDEDTRTVKSGALWLEESLPPETVLLGLLAAERSRRPGSSLAPEQVLQFVLAREQALQFGGKATTGRGRCRIVPLPAQEGTHARR